MPGAEFLSGYSSECSNETTPCVSFSAETDSLNKTFFQQEDAQAKIKPVPLPLNIQESSTSLQPSDPVYDRLTELAIIATSPQSPLLRSSPPSPRKRSFSLSSLHSYARPPQSPVEYTKTSSESDFSTRLRLTPEDTSAAYTLSTMALKPFEFQPSMSPPSSPTKKATTTRTRHMSCPDTSKPKRPMNGFMLFARKFRMEYSHLYPGKDNRAISVILGDHWRKMKSEERNTYAQEARILAEEVKKVHPDCWKRKRSMSTST